MVAVMRFWKLQCHPQVGRQREERLASGNAFVVENRMPFENKSSG